MTFEVDKSKLLDSMGRPLTQSLFLEIGYKFDFAVYSLKDSDHHYRGEVYPSLKRLYLAHEDPTEYDFATTYLLGWNHWKRLNDNKVLRKHFDEWREELELKLRSQAVRDIMDQCANEGGSFQAAKWLADRGWDKRAAGRPSKSEQDKESRIQERIDDEFKDDVVRMFEVK
ncbi:hypothetical protein N9924_00730 [bacterium]|nr:hypothetical protein [bacterium]